MDNNIENVENNTKTDIVVSAKKQNILTVKDFIIELVTEFAISGLLFFLPQVIYFLARKPLCFGVYTLYESMNVNWYLTNTPKIIWIISSLVLISSKYLINVWNKRMFVITLVSNIVSFVCSAIFINIFFSMSGVKETVLNQIPLPMTLIVILLLFASFAFDTYKAYKLTFDSKN